MVAAEVLSGVLKRINNLLKDGLPMIDGRKDLIEKLCSQIQEFLREKPNTDPITNKMFMNLAYDIENAVEWHIVNGRNIEPGGGGLIKSLLMMCSETGKSPDNIDLLKFEEKIEYLKRQASSIEPVDQGSDSSYVDEHVAGMEDATSTLVSMLMDGDRTRWPGIAITGRVGVANTSIAKKVLNDPRVPSEFDKIAWTSVSEEFKERDVVEAMLIKLGFPQKELLMKMEMIELMEHLYDLQKGRKCLIVLDDIWSIDVWECIRFAFPNGHGNRIIITTQFQNVARHFRGKIYQAPTTMGSLELFKMHSGILDSDMEDNPQIKENVNNILSQCQDIQLAIVEVAKFLKGKKLDEWSDMRNFKQGGKIPDSRILNVLSSIYDKMPRHLKPYFLYLGQFPPDHLIPVDKLCLMMMADGLILSTSYYEGISMIESCLTELADRSLVIMVENDRFSATRGLRACRVHNLIHYLCIKIGKEEEFFQLVDFKKKTERNFFPRMHNRVAVYLKDYLDGIDSTSSYIPNSHSIRSLVLFGKDNTPSKFKWPQDVADLKDFQWTRVLDFDGVDFRPANNKIPKNIDKLPYLRYLGFRGCYLEELTLSCTNFLYLETLDLRVSTSCTKMIIPDVLWKLSNLINLYFPISFRSYDQGKLKLEGMPKLQVIENFPAGMCDANDLSPTKDLHIFTGIADGNAMGVKDIITLINGKANLCHSSLTLKNFDCYSKDRLSLVRDVLMCDALRGLHLEGHLITMPKDLVIAQNFIDMVFDGSEFVQDPMPILGRLPQLRSLVLCNDAIVGKEIYCSGSSFKQLKSLKMGNLQYFEKWMLDSEAMPHLSVLTIEQCHKLQRLPDELMKRENLTELKIGSMPSVFEEIIRQRAEERFIMTITSYVC
ncbi:hypothetical protein ACJIZ3_013698 [Penstemon smallii]|uniref:NB-ARC domain-containing protein n=1 Tax=Penstemon smallii TaxID=265156 RepID=A0ABD3RU85_9LAMI